jgi:hypothetical protein
MPTPPKPPQVEQVLPSELVFRPHPPGDPGPDIWTIVSRFDARQQAAFAHTVLASQIAVAEAHVEGLKQIQGAIGKLQG